MKKKKRRLVDSDIFSVNIKPLQQWLCQKAISNLGQFENEDGTLDINFTADFYWEFTSWTSGFIKDNDLCSMIFDYSEYGSGVEYSDSIIQEKIQTAYLETKIQILKLTQEKVDEDLFINDFSNYFNLNEVEKDILTFLLIEEYTRKYQFAWITEQGEEIYKKIHKITNQSTDDIKSSLESDSILIQENILLKIDNELKLNLEWENYFFKGELFNRKRAFQLFMNDGKYQSKNKKLPVQWDNDKKIPLDHFIYLESIKLLNNLTHGQVVHLTFSHLPKPDSMIFEKSLFLVVTNDLNLNPFILSRSTDCDQNNSKTLVNGNLRIAYKYNEFQKLLDEFRSRYPEYYLKEVSKFV